MSGYGYNRTPYVPGHKRDLVLVGYSGMPVGVVRGWYDLWMRLRGVTPDYNSVPLSDADQLKYRKQFLSGLRRDRVKARRKVWE